MQENFLQNENEELTNVSLDALRSVSKVGFKKLDVELPSTANEARFLIDNYYQVQQNRITAESQRRALLQGADTNSQDKKKSDEKLSSLDFVYEQYVAMEANAKSLLAAYCESNPLSNWASKVTGIGPVLAASLPAYLSIKKEPDGSTKMHAGSWWSYCGLNDNNRPWLGKEKSTKIVEGAIAEYGELNDQAMMSICGITGWNLDHFKNFKAKKDKKGETKPGCCKTDKKGNVVWDKSAVISACSVIPYNKELKVVCYKIGTSFHKVCNNDKSLYGRLFKERLQYETMMNEKGAYAEQAKQILNDKNFKSKETREIYESGKLPASHIYARCERYVTKLFISHAFECAYYIEYKKLPPAPYALKFCEGHVDYIKSEIPYEEAFR